MPTPIKRHVALQPLSREHHYALLLSWKIREGLKRKVEVTRIKKYTDWYWEIYLLPHIQFEEQLVYPILGKEHRLIKRAIREHRRLKRLFTGKARIRVNLSLIEEELVAHIRFEERVLFNQIQEVASVAELKLLKETYSEEKVTENWPDAFWA